MSRGLTKEFMEKEKEHKALDAGDIALLKSYVRDPALICMDVASIAACSGLSVRSCLLPKSDYVFQKCARVGSWSLLQVHQAGAGRHHQNHEEYQRGVRHQGVGHWPFAAQPVGSRRGQADARRGAAFAGTPERRWDLCRTSLTQVDLGVAQVARCTKIIQGGKDETGKDELKYLINAKQHGKYVVDLGEKVSPTDIEEGMRIGYGARRLASLYKFLMSHALQCGPQEVPDPDPVATQDRSFCESYADSGEA